MSDYRNAVWDEMQRDAAPVFKGFLPDRDIKRCRKPYRCDHCRRTIPVGSAKHEQRWKDDEGLHAMASCAACRHEPDWQSKYPFWQLYRWGTGTYGEDPAGWDLVASDMYSREEALRLGKTEAGRYKLVEVYYDPDALKVDFRDDVERQEGAGHPWDLEFAP